ncbi:MAG: hypothetical protein IJ229_14265 [Clostridia bacterium]|nr:hypothetical protein [Clostridia bacterium]MBR1685317.1 hypothetical protein [Clostridia bacterium]MBR2287772.1 hypothetical protein [Clostridia bacterium]
MERVLDVFDRLACMVDAQTGVVECKCRDTRMTASLGPGESCRIERDLAVTTVSRMSGGDWKVTRMRQDA